jgi:O-antigen/teichoic acid export membrane protein
MVADTLFLASMYSFEKAGVWAMAQYFATVLEAPVRSLTSSAVPMVAEYWRQKNRTGILSVYKKSCINLLLVGLALGGLIIINIPNLLLFLKNPEYAALYIPLIILVISKLINLGTGLNEMIIKLSTRWRFDFISTIIYSLVGIPLNFFLIRSYGMTGAAVANLLAMLVYNGLRWWFLYKNFGLQPFDRRFPELLLVAGTLIALLALLPHAGHWLPDLLWRSVAYVLLFGTWILYRGYSEEVNWLWAKWSRKLWPKK